ncbi:hypothetical protein B0H11DRAFT_2378436 [Mycena galericulata]|nr:hypothetical protein B0H11DRAFT_2378436 [Mycena galericulata]
MARHPTLYFSDGTLILRAGDGTLYNVYRHHLITLSDCFNGMLTLPIPERPLGSLTETSKEWVETGRKAKLEGFGDQEAVQLPPQFTAMECEKFLEFIFSTNGWSPDVPEIDTLCAVLKTSHFFGVETGVEYAIHHLENHPALGAALRFRIGCDYQITHWIGQAFDELMTIPITEISAVDEALMGWQAYRALARTQAEVADHRTTLAVCPPAPTHSDWCHNLPYCTQEWEKGWTAVSGVLGAFLKDELPGSDIHDKLETYSVGGMTRDCHNRTCNTLKETAERKSVLKREEEIIDRAVTALVNGVA